jgi:hypothetical protein
MPKLQQSLPRAQQLELAVQTRNPAGLAQTFAAYVGQFYDRTDFDALAREVHDLYRTVSAENAIAFRLRLDRRLCDRYHAPVAWDTAAESGRAA